MTIDTKNIVSITDANRNFSRVARLVDESGSAIIMKNNAPRYVLLEFSQLEAEQTLPDEEVMRISERIMEENREAYEALADIGKEDEHQRAPAVIPRSAQDDANLILPPNKNPATERSFCVVAASPSSQRSCRLRLLPAPCHDTKILAHLLGFLSGASITTKGGAPCPNANPKTASGSPARKKRT